jgi:hypothetical protein
MIQIPFKDIKTIFERLGIELEEVCYYQDKTRAEIIEIIEEINELISYYNFLYRRKLIELMRLNY